MAIRPADKERPRRTGAYLSWSSMMSRCFAASTLSFALYGGRGITVCDRWRCFKNFLADMGERPAGHSLDRINNNGNYELGNCRWATKAQQDRNRRTNIHITANGRTMVASDWAKELGISKWVIYGRVRRGLPETELLAPVGSLSRTPPIPERHQVVLAAVRSGATSLREIGDAAGLTVSQASGVMHRLAARGLVENTPGKRRSYRVAGDA